MPVPIPQFQAQRPPAVHTTQAAAPINQVNWIQGARQAAGLAGDIMGLIRGNPLEELYAAQATQMRQNSFNQMVAKLRETDISGRDNLRDAYIAANPEWRDQLMALDLEHLQHSDVGRGQVETAKQQEVDALAGGPAAMPLDRAQGLPTAARDDVAIPAEDPDAGHPWRQVAPDDPSFVDPKQALPSPPPVEGTPNPALTPERALEAKYNLRQDSVYRTDTGELKADISELDHRNPPVMYLSIPPQAPGDHSIKQTVAKTYPILNRTVQSIRNNAMISMHTSWGKDQLVDPGVSIIASLGEQEVLRLQREMASKSGVTDPNLLSPVNIAAVAMMFSPDPDVQKQFRSMPQSSKYIRYYNNSSQHDQKVVLGYAAAWRKEGLDLATYRSLDDHRRRQDEIAKTQVETAKLRAEAATKPSLSDLAWAPGGVKYENMKARTDLTVQNLQNAQLDYKTKKADFDKFQEQYELDRAKAEEDLLRAQQDTFNNRNKGFTEARRSRTAMVEHLHTLHLNYTRSAQDAIEKFPENLDILVQNQIPLPPDKASDQLLARAGVTRDKYKAHYANYAFFAERAQIVANNLNVERQALSDLNKTIARHNRTVQQIELTFEAAGNDWGPEAQQALTDTLENSAEEWTEEEIKTVLSEVDKRVSSRKRPVR